MRWQVKAATSRIAFPGSGTKTANGLSTIKNNVMPGRRSGVRAILIVLTDGTSSDRNLVQGVARQIQGDGVEIYTIGVGDAIQASELALSASQPSSKYGIAATFTNLASFGKRLSTCTG